ncbi:MAG: gliding motility-associated C-terminal domain-containing protein [Saprospiraceae bacterium]
MNTKIRLVLFLLALPMALMATHNRAGEIHVEQIGPLTVRATIITWTKASSVNADRDTLTLCWGDGTCEQVGRSNGNGNGQVLPNDIKYNLYIAEHTFAGPATYRISMTDPNRIAGIVNVNPPSSDNVPFHIETIYSFQDPQFGGTNTTPYLLQPPIDNACIGKPFKHNANAYDPDGDSLSYKLITPLQSLGAPVPNYSFPSQIVPGPDNIFQLDPVTGDLLWLTPQFAGEYNVAFIIISWRDGVPIDTTIRDMQIFVDDCDNNPPEVATTDDICVVAGDEISFEVQGTDPDNDLVFLSALGGPFATQYSPATFSAPGTFQPPVVTGTFTWQTSCEHISNQAYSVVFKAVDSISNTIPQLADLKTVEIKVVGPPPLDVNAVTNNGAVEVTWENPYRCEDAAENYFYGFSVWRREGSNPFVVDTCTPGLAGKGYTELIYNTREEQNGRYFFLDENVESGKTYCYRVLAKFARISAGGYPYNIVESLPSEEVCAQLPRNLPLITHVDVLETDPASGRIHVRWSKPVAEDLDTLINHGPYRYQLLRAPNFTGGTLTPVPGAEFTAQEFWQANDTTFEDQGLDTENQPWRYQIAFYTRGNFDTPLGSTNPASSVFLEVVGSDNTNELSWRADVPWSNYETTVYRLNETTQVFEPIATTDADSYLDLGLENGKEYCYKVQTEGTYSIPGVVDPLLNFSQEACAVPIDTQPPCVPMLEVSNFCLTGEPDIIALPPFENELIWTNPNSACPGPADAVAYNLWYAPDEDSPLEILAFVDDITTTNFSHFINDGLAACYAVSAIDSAGNESAQSARTCVDNCPKYELPNTFSPNSDGANDFFTPFPGWRFVDRVEFQVFNRWGNLVYTTNEPELNWDGTDSNGKALSAGTYFYICYVYEKRVGGSVLSPHILRGYIELIKG